MTNRDRLIKLIINAKRDDPETGSFTEFLADYLIANGVIVPPCKVGDKIYQTDRVRIYESTINEITFTKQKMICVTENIAFDETAVGKTVFLTREEAEKALERSKGNA